MKKAVWKFPLELGVSRVEMPVGATLLQVGTQHQRIVLWALVDTENKKETREFFVIGTGHKFDWMRSIKYLGSCQFECSSGSFPYLVWHVFEGLPKDVDKF